MYTNLAQANVRCVYNYLGKMIYDEFLELISEKINNQSDYKSLCRFCLERNSNRVDLSSECAEAFAIQDNYFTITKQCLQRTFEHPNFICSACEHRLSDIASFIQEIIENGKHWEIYLENEKDVKPERIEEIDCNHESVDVSPIIKEENCETNFDNAIETNGSYAYDSSTQFDKWSTKDGDGPTTADMQIDTSNKKSRKRNTERVTFRTPPTTIEYDRTCKFCDTPTFASMQQFYNHQERQHPDQKIFACDICGLNYTKKARLYGHMRDNHFNVHTYVCNLCVKSFTQKKYLDTHMKTGTHNAYYERAQHKQSNKILPNQFQIKKVINCYSRAPSRKQFILKDQTINRNLEHRNYECDVCRSTYTSQDTLNSHKLIHSRSFLCNASFNQSSHLSVHFNREHTENKPFQCIFCDERYSEREELASHVQWHKNQQRVKCDICSCDFTTLQYLKTHMLRQHHGHVSYDCKFCNKECPSSMTLNIHLLKYHKSELHVKIKFK